MLDELLELWSADAISTINRHTAACLAILHGFHEGSGELLVVTLFAGLAVIGIGTLGIEAADKVVQLWSGEEAMVGVLGLCGVEPVDQGVGQGRAGSASVAGEDDARLGTRINFEIDLELLVSVKEGLIALSVGDLGGVGLPRTLLWREHGQVMMRNAEPYLEHLALWIKRLAWFVQDA